MMTATKEMHKKNPSAPIRRSRSAEIWHQYKKNKGAVVGLVVLIFIVIVCIVSNIAFDYETDIIGMNTAQRLMSPCLEHPFGTDQMGRDILARVCYGAKYSLMIGIVAVIISVMIGSVIGATAGYLGGRAESIIMRIVEMLLLIPGLLLSILIVNCLGASLGNLMLALGLATVPHFARNARAAVLTVRGNEYVEAARAIGAKSPTILFKHVIPNAMSPILVQATSRIAICIIDAASYSFLGLGVPPPQPEWGAMLADGRDYMLMYPHLEIFPGLAIIIVVLAVNLIGDGVRDALDPKLKR